jgi:hypothetical protein
MLETCVSLVDCERVLIEKFQRVKFIGEIELSSEDIRKLTNFINTELDRDPRRGLRLLRQRAPGTIAAFLVWQGIIGYGEGDYWTSALRAIGLDEPRWQQQIVSDILWEISFENGVVVAPVIFSREDIENGPLFASPIYRVIMKEGIPV